MRETQPAVPHKPTLRVCAALLILGAGCMTRLPDQDLRIRTAVPVAKLSAADLWQDYQRNRAEADAKYWSKAVEVSGKVTAVIPAAPGSASASVVFGQANDLGIRANLLDEDSAEILKVAAVGQRVTLRCFCDGLSGHVVLKSCVRP